MSYFELVFRCAVELTRGGVLQAGEVSAGRGDVIDWRAVRSGETVLHEGDAYSQATLFVEHAGSDAVISMFTERDLTSQNEQQAHQYINNKKKDRI